ncbi:uncharacterized protein DUF3472 [Chitinophaga dinghuensis]|uniref:Uncharacterized protein DUF3472 n=1 Tax=Chitinophaga dinghuensis TaxID=1539050 RepID=A0A327VMJ2_9BACT|nr:DUF5077 domain-containing protein [Chitinophaga dinghuensis]RAJ76551.1 uncharacterized protein DUF3472 [Chitinophaga dinghuensis]
MKMNIRFIFTLLMAVGLLSCSKNQQALPAANGAKAETVPAASSYLVPLAGNGFVTTLPSGAPEVITSNGLGNWTNANSVTSTYFRLGLTGTLTIGVRVKVPSGTSVIKVTVNGTSFNQTITGTAYTDYTVGTVNVTSTGYVKVDLQGVSKSGGYFGDVSNIIISGTATANNVVYANDASNYYWSRRGPSVHLNYTIPSGTTAEWFYNEVTVPSGQDQIGSYFMSNGFNGGYFGIQVNSATERRVLFSIWDPSVGKTTLVRKGTNVVDNTFGGEGTGGQSYLVFNWQAGTTYKFLTHVLPDGAGGTDFSSWIYTPETSSWRFIATWKQPNTTTYLGGLYSFLENFTDTNGYLGRSGQYSNSWIRSTTGVWTELTSAKFTADATATNDQRRDYAGGVDSSTGRFFLQNGGFFSNYINYNTTFTRTATGVAPTVDLTTLP